MRLGLRKDIYWQCLGAAWRWLARTVRHFDAARSRRRKAMDAFGWLARWDSACARSWAILTNGTPTRERFERWYRNHSRLCRLIEAKNAKICTTENLSALTGARCGINPACTTKAGLIKRLSEGAQITKKRKVVSDERN